MATFMRILTSNRSRLFNKNLSQLFSVVNSKDNSFRHVFTTNYLFAETPIKMPALSPTMTAGTIVKWHKKEGEKINAGDILCEVQTDKAVVAFEFDDDGILAKILVNENSAEIQVGDLIAIVCEEDDDWKNVKIPENLNVTSDTIVSPVKSESLSIKQPASDSISKSPIDINTIKISPSARNLMDQYGIEMSTIQPTGNRGVMMKEDVLKFIQQNSLQPKNLSVIQEKEASKMPKDSSSPAKSDTPFFDIEISNMRRTIAKRLTESKSNIPHAYMRIKCSMDGLLKLRKDYKEKSLSVSLNDMIVKATALALKQTPAMNCQWDSECETIRIVPDIDVSIAVATPTGLITPIIKNANCLSLEEISNNSKELIVKAKDGKLQPHEFIGGTFSISNLGMYDIDHFVGVINPPQAAILAVGATRQRFFGEPDDYHICNQTIMSLSYDARAINEELAAHFMEKLRDNLEDTDLLITSDGSIHRRLSSFI
ncbi:pyruvate dehydrogenase protein X component [Dermatophagoides farinae]|uniref:pyruvate dehydrogenase protein X component n=1 Tax=Dermatophagoides farinae TaxID=6954 RepID=UPI001F11676F|nr:dihydrolipoyllysine-residue acetyltransferase component 1 of pyruvate dehydrogenase complex, mitochondrial-like [Dermatophagoides farinae]